MRKLYLRKYNNRYYREGPNGMALVTISGANWFESCIYNEELQLPKYFMVIGNNFKLKR